MRTLIFTKELILDYYTNDFSKDLCRYFDIWPPRNREDVAFIGFLTCDQNHNRIIEGSPATKCLALLSPNRYQKVDHVTEKNFIFAGIFYFFILIPQTLREMYGEAVEKDFYRSSGWPLISAGLGGYLPPTQMLREATLYPCDAERENFHRMMKEVSPIMLKEIEEFIYSKNNRNLNDNAYRRLLDALDGKQDILIQILREKADNFTQSLI